MEVRIKFSADLIIKADTIEEVREKWEGIPLFSVEAGKCGVEFGEVLLIEDANTYEDLWSNFY